MASGSCNLPSREALPVKTSKPNFVTFFVYFGKSLFDYNYVKFLCLFTAANWEAILLVTCSLGGTGGESVNSTGHSLIE